jgi:hypothetical protein
MGKNNNVKKAKKQADFKVRTAPAVDISIHFSEFFFLQTRVFQHVKKKLGKKLLPVNSTATHFRTAKIQVSSQKALNAFSQANDERLKDLVHHTAHHSPADRKNALKCNSNTYIH